MTFWITQLLNGISFGMLLFLLAAGLMRILNLAHGSYCLLGGVRRPHRRSDHGKLCPAEVAGTAAVVVLGILMERFFLRRFPQQAVPQALADFVSQL